MRNVPSSTGTPVRKADPPITWQSVQWQIDTLPGSISASNFKLPQWHAPLTFISLSPLSNDLRVKLGGKMHRKCSFCGPIRQPVRIGDVLRHSGSPAFRIPLMQWFRSVLYLYGDLFAHACIEKVGLILKTCSACRRASSMRSSSAYAMAKLRWIEKWSAPRLAA